MSEKVAIIVRKEVLENLKSLRYWGLIGLFVLLFVATSATVGSAMRGLRIPGLELGRGRLVVQLVGSL